MDRETAQDIKRHFDGATEAVRSEMHELAVGLRGEMRELAVGLPAEMQELAVGLRGEMHELAVGLRAEMHELAVGLRGEIRVVDEKGDRNAVDLKRYFDVVGESLRSDIRTVAEGFVSTNERLDRLESAMAEKFGELEVMIRLSFGELARRIH